ncbi:1-hydroxy-2-methyl-2-(E)-butenyl 4-diphosphate synthase [Klebsiella pneumoniae]|uniref:1-hydroxy-2-methyl-2-(E)-butenyl 4-diphosphate synthase n=1 Tax=Klebsiella pneumoniae TaxID=573 RepID=A0A377XM77_KLEPN|nr:1-hydroxy-2-methyl-2-(E)-butenyl 4-diphosphate synthase [Klebsiella pneumoniae]
MSSWRWNPIVCWRNRSISRCISGSPKRAARRSGAVKSAIGLGLLLSEGIGDTLRVSLAADPVEEIKVGFDILKSLRIRSRGINFIACPTCSRQEF